MGHLYNQLITVSLLSSPPYFSQPFTPATRVAYEDLETSLRIRLSVGRCVCHNLLKGRKLHFHTILYRENCSVGATLSTPSSGWSPRSSSSTRPHICLWVRNNPYCRVCRSVGWLVCLTVIMF